MQTLVQLKEFDTRKASKQYEFHKAHQIVKVNCFNADTDQKQFHLASFDSIPPTLQRKPLKPTCIPNIPPLQECTLEHTVTGCHKWPVAYINADVTTCVTT